MSNILEALIRASERAACIARSCTNFNGEMLLVTEKGEAEANTRFERDFKTIADVLAQEYAKAEIALQLPSLARHVRGEERNEINGVTITLENSVEETEKTLNLLLPPSTAKQMAKAAHDKICHFPLKELPNVPELNPDDIGVWIDPIDATAEFIAGVRGEAAEGCGLTCVTVLIGAYLKSSGEPVAGVINQPFYNEGKGRIIWGVTYQDIQKWCDTSNQEITSENKVVLISGSEKPDIVNKLMESGWEVKAVPGAGHKLLKVVLGEAAAYVLSKGSTYSWDTCAPHAILIARGGGLISFNSQEPITYIDGKVETKEHCNTEGIIAYAEDKTLKKILKDLK
ncbi:inositol polyphosphate 1-phosphatase [Battus philenor]|uniref:inositol polyphosphate 1-phosphatase n=1 Tax=Battus philenor TaxID=42288 RepID=UPI0035D09F1B